jgi:uncharacterized LabA/DUF88 family protein
MPPQWETQSNFDHAAAGALGMPFCGRYLHGRRHSGAAFRAPTIMHKPIAEKEFRMFDPREKIALFIDGANLYATSRALGFDIDYRKLLASFQKRGYLLRAYYYTALVEDQEYSSIRPLIDWLDYNGYKVVTKPAKEFTDSTGRRKIKGNMDIELTIDALELADVVDHYVIFSGDGDFRTLVEALQRRGRKVSIISTMASQPPMISDDLRRQADHFIDLMSLKADVGRDPSERPVRRPEPAVQEADDDY